MTQVAILESTLGMRPLAFQKYRPLVVQYFVACEGTLFGKDRGAVIAEGLKIVGRVTAEGLVEVNGQIEGDMRQSGSRATTRMKGRQSSENRFSA